VQQRFQRGLRFFFASTMLGWAGGFDGGKGSGRGGAGSSLSRINRNAFVPAPNAARVFDLISPQRHTGGEFGIVEFKRRRRLVDITCRKSAIFRAPIVTQESTSARSCLARCRRSGTQPSLL
jgi:hypothetical protein